MKTSYSLVGLAVLILTSSAAWPLSDEDCDYSGKQSQMNACAIRDFETADRELNRVYRQLMSMLPKSAQKALQKEQRSWLKERDPKCRKEANDEAEGGSMWPMLFNSCRATFTQTRIEQLKKWKR